MSSFSSLSSNEWKEAVESVAKWSETVSAWNIGIVEAAVADWQTRDINDHGRDFLENSETLLAALRRIAVAAERAIMASDASREIAYLNPKLFNKLSEIQTATANQHADELADLDAEDLKAGTEAVEAGEYPSVMAWHKTRQAREEGSDLMAELEAANQPRNASLIPLGTLAQLQALLAQTDTIICQQRTFTVLPQDSHNSEAVLDLDAIAEPRIIEEDDLRSEDA